MKSKKLYSKCHGHEKNPKLIFLHGFMGSGSDFEPIIQHLEQDYFCVTLDLPGHGQSQKILPSSITEFDELMIQELKSFEPLSLIGYSLGGRIAQKIAPFLALEALVLISSKGLSLTESERKARERSERLWQHELSKKPFKDFLSTWYSSPLFNTLKQSDEIYTKMLKTREQNSAHILGQMLELTSPLHYYSPLQDVKAPVLYIAGAEDEKYASEQKKLKEELPRLQTQLVPKTSHAVHLEEPKLFAQILKQFWRQTHDTLETNSRI